MKSRLSIRSKFSAFGLVLVISLAMGGRAAAQEPLAPEHLPTKTTFYLVWRGAPAPALRKANGVLALWDDAGFAPVRSAITEGLLKNSDNAKTKTALTREELDEYSSLIENPFVAGYVAEPEAHRRKRMASKETPSPSAWNGMFLVYDQTGKELLLAKAILRMRKQETEAPQISAVVLGGVTAVKVQRKAGASYWATTGKYAISASEQTVFEDIVSRLKSVPAAGPSLGESAAYREALPQLNKSALVEFFLQVPDLKELAGAPVFAPGKFNFRAALDDLHIDAVHSLCLSLLLDGPRTRITGGVLGDAKEGTLFDLWPNGVAQPASLALAPADTISYSETRMDLGGLYKTILHAVRAGVPEGQGGMVDMVDSMAQSRIGMSIGDALNLFTGEFAAVQQSPDLDQQKQLIIVGIRNKPDVLKLTRSILSTQIISQREEGNATYLKISSHASQSNAGTAQWGAFNVAITPDLALGAMRRDTVVAALMRRAQGASGGLAGQPRFREVRARFPEAVESLSFFDVQRIDLQAVKSRWMEEAKKAAKTNPSAASVNWLDTFDPQVISRHVHTMSSASWKDAKGVRFDLWIE